MSITKEQFNTPGLKFIQDAEGSSNYGKILVKDRDDGSTCPYFLDEDEACVAEHLSQVSVYSPEKTLETFTQSTSLAKREVLEELLQRCDTLHEKIIRYDPTNKISYLDVHIFKNEIEKMLKELELVDKTGE